MNGMIMGLVLAAAIVWSPHPGQPDGPLFDLLADMPSGEQTTGAIGHFIQAPVAVPETGKNKVTMGAGFGQDMAFSVVLKLEKEGESRELTISPLFFVPSAPGFLKVKVLIKGPKRES